MKKFYECSGCHQLSLSLAEDICTLCGSDLKSLAKNIWAFKYSKDKIIVKK